MRLELARNAIQEADYILIGGGAGLSTAAGLDYGGARFTKNFSDYHEEYGIPDMYSGMFYQFETLEETWAYRARHIELNRFKMGATELYAKLYKLVENRKYFVLTTNGDHQFFLAGFNEENIFATQGDYSGIQCSKACHDKIYDNESLINKMRESTVNFKVPTELVPMCPNCGEPMSLHLRVDEYFIENNEYQKNAAKYQEFVKEIRNQKVVLLEIGVGFNTPGIVKYPFERLTYQNPNSSLIRINKYHPQGSDENKEKTLTFSEDVERIISDLLL